MSNIITVKSGNVNCYIVTDNGKDAILVDTGRKKDREKILSTCQEYHITLIVLTHGHLDHCQNAAYLAEKLNVPIAMSRLDLNMIPNNMNQTLNAGKILGKLVKFFSIRSFHKESMAKFRPTVFLKDGMKLNRYGADAKIIALPGHTNGSIGVLIQNDKLIAGDALMNMFYPTVSMLYTNKAEMERSALKISDMGNITIYFGHGKPIQNRKWKG